MNAVEMHYTPGEVAVLLRVCTKTVVRKLRAGEFGAEVTNIGTLDRPDYRIPASAVNAYLARGRVFKEPGIAARSTGELRRKAKAAGGSGLDRAA